MKGRVGQGAAPGEEVVVPEEEVAVLVQALAGLEANSPRDPRALRAEHCRLGTLLANAEGPGGGRRLRQRPVRAGRARLPAARAAGRAALRGAVPLRARQEAALGGGASAAGGAASRRTSRPSHRPPRCCWSAPSPCIPASSPGWWPRRSRWRRSSASARAGADTPQKRSCPVGEPTPPR